MILKNPYVHIIQQLFARYKIKPHLHIMFGDPNHEKHMILLSWLSWFENQPQAQLSLQNSADTLTGGSVFWVPMCRQVSLKPLTSKRRSEVLGVQMSRSKERRPSWPRGLSETWAARKRPSGNDVHSWLAVKWSLMYSGFSHEKWWLSTSLCLITRGIQKV